MAKKQTKTQKPLRTRSRLPRRADPTESDGTYFLKLVLYMILGSLWIKFAHPLHLGIFTLNGLPVGLFIGALFARQDHFQVDRKIAYALLLIMMIITYFLPAGIVI